MTSWNEFVEAQRRLAAEGWGFVSFRDALRSWIATVAIVEVEFVGEYERYSIELMARDYLDALARRSPPTHAKRVQDALAIWDERFRAATDDWETPHRRAVEGERPPGWWWYRRPRRW